MERHDVFARLEAEKAAALEQDRAETAQELEQLSQLVNHPAWKRYVEVFGQAMDAAVHQMKTAKSGEELLDLRARWTTIENMISWPERQAAALRQFLEEK